MTARAERVIKRARGEIREQTKAVRSQLHSGSVLLGFAGGIALVLLILQARASGVLSASARTQTFATRQPIARVVNFTPNQSQTNSSGTKLI